jgi:hypothetical protein
MRRTALLRQGWSSASKQNKGGLAALGDNGALRAGRHHEYEAPHWFKCQQDIVVEGPPDSRPTRNNTFGVHNQSLFVIRYAGAAAFKSSGTVGSRNSGPTGLRLETPPPSAVASDTNRLL